MRHSRMLVGDRWLPRGCGIVRPVRQCRVRAAWLYRSETGWESSCPAMVLLVACDWRSWVAKPPHKRGRDGTGRGHEHLPKFSVRSSLVRPNVSPGQTAWSGDFACAPEPFFAQLHVVFGWVPVAPIDVFVGVRRTIVTNIFRSSPHVRPNKFRTQLGIAAEFDDARDRHHSIGQVPGTPRGAHEPQSDSFKAQIVHLGMIMESVVYLEPGHQAAPAGGSIRSSMGVPWRAAIA